VIHNRAAVGVASYLALMAAWIYGFENTSVRLGHEDLANGSELAFFAVLQIGLGIVVGRRWALLVYGLAIAVAIPAGRPPWLYHDQPAPLWRTLLYAAVLALPLIGLGVALRRLGPRVRAA
jgi:hypothetical protein